MCVSTSSAQANNSTDDLQLAALYYYSHNWNLILLMICD